MPNKRNLKKQRCFPYFIVYKDAIYCSQEGLTVMGLHSSGSMTGRYVLIPWVIRKLKKLNQQPGRAVNLKDPSSMTQTELTYPKTASPSENKCLKHMSIGGIVCVHTTAGAVSTSEPLS